MKMLDIFEIIISDFFTKKMRTLLTILGVSIGVGAIVFLVSLGYGLQQLTIKKVTSLAALTTYDVNTGDSSIIKIDKELLEKMKKLSNVESVNPNYTVSAQVGYNNTWTDATAYGVNNQYLKLDGTKMQAGNYFDDGDKKMLITQSGLKALNIAQNAALGKTIKIKMYSGSSTVKTLTEKELVIGGVITEESSSYFYYPLGTMDTTNKIFASAKVKIKDQKSMAQARSDLENLGLKVSSIGDTISQLSKIFSIARAVLFGFGLIALMVASIGMFNTLTISLLEKTREIGIMKALGATDSFIRKIFLLEAITIGTLGGLSGVFIGWILGKGINFGINMLARSLGGESVQLFVTPFVFVLAIVAFSFVIGFLTGVYPSRRAARLNPLDALRYE